MAVPAALPRDCTTDQARELIAKQIGALNRAISEGAAQLAARDRIIERLTVEKAHLEEKLDALRALRADDKLVGAGTVAAARLSEELERWRGVVASTLSALEHALAQVPACFTLAPGDHPRPAPLPTLPSEQPSDESNNALICPTLEELQRPFPPATPPAGEDRCKGVLDEAPPTGGRSLGPLNDMLAVSVGSAALPAAGTSGCAVPWCPNKKVARGYCSTHYSHLSEHGDALRTKRYVKGANNGLPVMCREVGLGQYEPVTE